ncbi:MAG TPA: peptidylprolyl isomerase [Chthoniobacterales bacterium]
MAAAVLLGLAAGELLCRSPAFRNLAGRAAGRGRLVAIANGKGIYETDLAGDQELSVPDLIAAENLRSISAALPLDPKQVDRELALLKAQFGDEKKFKAALKSSALSELSLREKIEIQLRGLDWLEKQVATGATAAEQDCRNFYDAHRDLFAQPLRYRACHIFLAAHGETPPEVVEEKEKAIAVLATRLTKGEALSQLAAEISEDEASKPRGGDLSYFAETQMPVEFMIEIKKLRIGETSKPFRSHLGFHIVQLTEIKPARQLSFDEARSEIFLAFANEHRALQVERLSDSLSRSAY